MLGKLEAFSLRCGAELRKQARSPCYPGSSLTFHRLCGWFWFLKKLSQKLYFSLTLPLSAVSSSLDWERYIRLVQAHAAVHPWSQERHLQVQGEGRSIPPCAYLFSGAHIHRAAWLVSCSSFWACSSKFCASFCKLESRSVNRASTVCSLVSTLRDGKQGHFISMWASSGAFCHDGGWHLRGSVNSSRPHSEAASQERTQLEIKFLPQPRFFQPSPRPYVLQNL